MPIPRIKLGKKVIELGAGTGLVGMVSGLLGEYKVLVCCIMPIPRIKPGKKVIELGAGTGLVGMVSGLLG